MSLKNVKMEKRPENEPRFNMNNKTDRKIFFWIIGSVIILSILVVGCFILFNYTAQL